MKLKLLLIFAFAVQFASAQWTPLASGTTDNLTGIAMYNANGLVSGENGLYYTTDTGATWNPFTITGNAVDEAVYNNTSFIACAASPNWQSAVSMYAIGKNTVTNQAVIFRINFPEMTHAIIYTGAVGSHLNGIMFNTIGSVYYAAGDDGLIVKFSNTTEASVVTTNSTENFKSIAPGVLTADDKLIFGTLDYLGLTITQEVPMPDVTRAIMSWNNTNVSYGVGNTYATRTGASLANYTNFDFGPLNAKDISDYTPNYHLVATDHGIFRSGTDKTYLEWQPSSGTSQINDIFFVSSVATYAVGNNGVILKTTNGGGPAKPYIDLNLTIRCFGSNSIMKAQTGSSSSCQWFLDGNLIGNSCGQFSFQFPSVGIYTISLTSTNASGLTSTDSEIVHVVNTPQVNQPVTISDQILCNSEPIVITIQNSELDVVYTLKKSGDMGTFGTSGPGNGSAITFTTSSIDVSGTYFLEAKSIYGSCALNFTDTFSITVEETEALFHSSLINANPNEPFTMFNQSIDAQNFEWTFSPGGSLTGSNLQVVPLTYSSAGETQATLHAWSDNGCHNTITAAGPYIYDAPAASDSWTINHPGTDIANNSGAIAFWTGDWELESTELVKVEDGLLTSGQYKDQVFASRAGVTLNLDGKSGSYLTKHDLNGVLKFVVYTVKEPTSEKDAMTSAVADSQGNIYITCRTLGHFYDSTGTRYDFDTSYYTNSAFIIKLDPNGKYLWRMQASSIYPTNLYIDNFDNVVVTSVMRYFEPVQWMFNGAGSGHFVTGMEITPSNDHEYLVTKFDAGGAMLWDAPVYINDVNGSFLTHVDFDAANNMYMTGHFEQSMHMHSADGSSVESLYWTNNMYGTRTFVAKYDQNGIVQWLIKSDTEGGTSEGVRSYDHVTDAAGNTFISGSNNCRQPGWMHRFLNTDGSITQESVGRFFVAKVNSEGICEWIRGAGHTFYGFGYQIIKHNDEISVIAQFSNNGPEFTTATFTSTDNFTHELTIYKQDFFMATYDTAGNLLRITGNGENEGSFAWHYFSGFAKGDEDSYFLSGSFSIAEGYPYTTFGQELNVTNNTDAFLTKFNEQTGVQYLSRTLGVDDFSGASVRLHPNPTSGRFTISLGQIHSKISVEVSDLSGKKIFTKTYDNVSEITENTITSSGIYFIKLASQDKTTTLKMVRN